MSQSLTKFCMISNRLPELLVSLIVPLAHVGYGQKNLTAKPMGVNQNKSVVRSLGKYITHSRLSAYPLNNSPTKDRRSYSTAASNIVDKDHDSKLPLFHYRDYPNPPKIVYTSCPEEADKHLSQLQGSVLGFDLEWTPFSSSNGIDLIQFGNKDLIVLYQITGNQGLPPNAIDIINDPNIYKIGVNIKGDLNKLIDNFDMKPASFLELSRLARLVEPEWKGKGKRLISLADQCEHYLGKVLDKNEEVRSGNWSNKSNEIAINYAANDVYSSIMIYDKLTSMANDKSLTIDYKPLFVDSDLTPKPKPSQLITPAENELRPFVGPIKYTIAGKELELPTYHKKPVRSELKALEAFMNGAKVSEYAKENRIKEITVQKYISDTVNKFGMTNVFPSEEEQDRYIAEGWRRPPGVTLVSERVKEEEKSVKGEERVEEAQGRK